MDKTNDKPIRATCSLSDLRISFFVLVKFSPDWFRATILLNTIPRTATLMAKRVVNKLIRFC